MSRENQPFKKRGHGCTIFIVTPGASADGSMLVGHTNDGFGSCVVGHELVTDGNKVVYVPAADHPEGTKRPILFDPDSGSDGEGTIDKTDPAVVSYIDEVPHTYGYLTGSYGIMNEHQLLCSECTDFAKIEPNYEPGRRIFYSSELSNIALERCTQAREAVELVGNLIDQYGVYGTGETLLFADPNEAWVLEMCGSDTEDCVGLWVAKKVPDGNVFVASNIFRIRGVPELLPHGMLCSKNLHKVAKEKGWWDGKSTLDWLTATSTGEYSHPYYSLARIWSIYNRLAPSQNFSPYVQNSWWDKYPFSIKPDEKLTTRDAFQIFRDHYEGTVFDLTTGLAAGPYGNPYRDDGPFDAHDLLHPGEIKPGSWPRPISVFNCTYSYVAQARSYLHPPAEGEVCPPAVGGVCWLGFAQPSETCYMPIYAGAKSVPVEFNCGNRNDFTRSSGWWAFNFVTNWATLRYCQMIEDIRAEQHRIEDEELSRQAVIEKTAEHLYKTKGLEACCSFLTQYCSRNALSVISDWWRLSDRLIIKYCNGQVNEVINGEVESTRKGYPAEWLGKVGYQYGPRIYQYKELQETGCVLYVEKTETTKPGAELEYIRKYQTCRKELGKMRSEDDYLERQ